MDKSSHDLAANYARDLIAMHSCAEGDDNFCARILGYQKEDKQSSHGLCQLPTSGYRDFETETRTSQAPDAQLPKRYEGENVSPLTSTHRLPPNLRLSNDSSVQQLQYFSPTNHVSTPNGTFQGSQLPNPSMYRRSNSQSFNNMAFESFAPNDDELTAISHTLLGNDFMEMDRVITFDGTDFSMNLGGWGSLSGSQQFNE
jgi:hypothetical protein